MSTSQLPFINRVMLQRNEESIKPLSSAAFMFASAEAFRCGDAARYLEISLKPAV